MKEDLTIIAESILNIQAQCNEALHAVARINAYISEPVEVDIKPDPEPHNDSIEIGGVKFDVIEEPVHNLLVVDPRPLLAHGFEWQKYDHTEDFVATDSATLRPMETLQWQSEDTHKGKYPQALHFGCWAGNVTGFRSPHRCVYVAYYYGGKWNMLFSAARRDDNVNFMPLTTGDPYHGEIENSWGPYKGMKLKNLSIPPMSETHGAYVLCEYPPPHHKCHAFPLYENGKYVPRLAFIATWDKGENEISEAILQLS